MEEELDRYIQKLKQQRENKPIWEKDCLSIEETAAYSGIGRNKLRQITGKKKCPFVVPLGNQIYVNRTKFDEFIKNQEHI